MPASGWQPVTVTPRSMPRRAVPTAVGCTATIWPNNSTKKPPPETGEGDQSGRRRRKILLPRRRDFLLQRVEADGAHHQFGADHIARRAADAEGVGELHVLVDGGLDFVAVHILLDPRHVEAGVLGGRERVRLVGRTAAAKKLLMEFDVLLA